MGRKLRQQRRGKGSNTYTKLPGTYDISVSYTSDQNKKTYGEVISMFNHTGHTAPIMEILYEDFSRSYMLAPEGIAIGDKVYTNSNYSLGSVVALEQIPEGIPIYNIESEPGDGGKFVKAAGASAYIVGRVSDQVSVLLPSKATVLISHKCRAQLGVVSGGGATDQPLMKAGKNFYLMHRLNRIWPGNRGVKMAPVDHPFGGKEHHKGKSSMTSRNAPPGRKVGHIAARRVGRKKR